MQACFDVGGIEDAELLTTALAVKNLRLARQRQSIVFPIGSGVTYRREGIGRNRFKTYLQCLNDGHCDCEDAVAWLVAWCWFNGVPARVLAVRTGPRMLHLLAVVRGVVVDPSRLMGMR